MSNNILKSYIKKRGVSIRQAAIQMGISRQSIYNAQDRNMIGPKLAIIIEKWTSGEISRSDLRPDLWEKSDIYASNVQ